MRLIESYSLNSADAMILRSALDVATELHSIGDTLVTRRLRSASSQNRSH